MDELHFANAAGMLQVHFAQQLKQRANEINQPYLAGARAEWGRRTTSEMCHLSASEMYGSSVRRSTMAHRSFRVICLSASKSVVDDVRKCEVNHSPLLGGTHRTRGTPRRL